MMLVGVLRLRQVNRALARTSSGPSMSERPWCWGDLTIALGLGTVAIVLLDT